MLNLINKQPTAHLERRHKNSESTRFKFYSYKKFSTLFCTNSCKRRIKVNIYDTRLNDVDASH